jgi:hypothetical protein
MENSEGLTHYQAMARAFEATRKVVRAGENVALKNIALATMWATLAIAMKSAGEES